MEDKIQIRNSHLAMLHLLTTNLSHQYAINMEVINLIAEYKGETTKVLLERINQTGAAHYQKTLSVLYQEYGVLDPDELLKNPLTEL